jgi:hypothetical protein
MLTYELAGAPRQQPSAEGGSTTGTSQGRVLLHPPRSAIEAELIEDPMLSAESLKNFQDTFKDLYRFSTVSCLPLLRLLFVCFLNLTINLILSWNRRWRTAPD